HLVHQPGAFTKPLLEGLSVFLLYIDAIGDSYHDAIPSFPAQMIALDRFIHPALALNVVV
ncbi:MAG TPA: hypothetical protein VN843_33170, partial [Anaerolineales bacterium]|nr:hypothetical protein [Anaerolineales bacterium]